MKSEITIPEAQKITKPESFLESTRFDVRETVGDFSSHLMAGIGIANKESSEAVENRRLRDLDKG
ncbi:MAG: hypothetical protein OEY59_08265 [Deltaproteobacteria bacterium]|nr:hypothetical protein [Deltaproteobacteria bacterium]